ncbi:MAG: zinc ABC transporter substrate-binding protein, partial [Porticoccus sp.]
VTAIARALSEKWPTHEMSVIKKEKELLKKLTTLDESYHAQARKLAGKNIIYSHPVYQYFERRYQLPGYSLHWEPDQMPNQEQWELLNKLSHNKDSLLIWEDFPSQKIIEKLNHMQLKYTVIRPMANKSIEPTLKTNWLEEQKGNHQRMDDL